MKYILAIHVGNEVILYPVIASSEEEAMGVLARKHKNTHTKISPAIAAYSDQVRACYVECTSAMDRLTKAMSKDPMCRKEQFDYMEACTRLIGAIGEDNG